MLELAGRQDAVGRADHARQLLRRLVAEDPADLEARSRLWVLEASRGEWDPGGLDDLVAPATGADRRALASDLLTAATTRHLDATADRASVIAELYAGALLLDPDRPDAARVRYLRAEALTLAGADASAAWAEVLREPFDPRVVARAAEAAASEP